MDKGDITHHISQQFNDELEGVRNKVLEMGAVEPEPGRTGVREDVVSALVNLGYRPRDAEAALKKADLPGARYGVGVSDKTAVVCLPDPRGLTPANGSRSCVRINAVPGAGG